MRKVSEILLKAKWGSGYLYESGDKRKLMLLSLDGEPIMVVSKDGDGKGLYAIKDYSENEGILEAMVKANLVELTGNAFPSGFVILNEVKLLV